jgi:putative ABC transport system permease protein
LLGLVTALLLLAVIVAILGIVNTLVLSVVERTRELGLLRAVGATRRQVRTVVRRESVLMSLLGALTGVALGTGAGVALSRALQSEGLSTVTVPTTTLLVYLVVAAMVGVLAAIGPARRASKVDVLTAITAE